MSLMMIGCVVVVIAAGLTSRYLKKEAQSEKQKRLIAIIFLVVTCPFLLGISWLDIHFGEVDLIKASWAVFKNTRQPREARRDSLKTLKKDDVLTKKALGKEYGEYKQVAADFEQIEFLLENANLVQKEHEALMQESKKFLDSYKELEPVIKSAREGKRTAPAGEYELILEMPEDEKEYSYEQTMLYLKTSFECVRVDQREQKGDAIILHFKGLQQEYAEQRAAEFRKLGLIATVNRP